MDGQFMIAALQHETNYSFAGGSFQGFFDAAQQTRDVALKPAPLAGRRHNPRRT
ncbi:MAG: hypothetical protein IPG91_10625 [Ideonella sp.]|nr:hypothetical protein [Ideonella sp.]